MPLMVDSKPNSTSKEILLNVLIVGLILDSQTLTTTLMYNKRAQVQWHR
jgi:hypothetical protein